MRKYDINPTTYLIGIRFGGIFKKEFVVYDYSHRYVFIKLGYVRVRDEKIQYRS